jgi:hypothetical protein
MPLSGGYGAVQDHRHQATGVQFGGELVTCSVRPAITRQLRPRLVACTTSSMICVVRIRSDTSAGMMIDWRMPGVSLSMSSRIVAAVG